MNWTSLILILILVILAVELFIFYYFIKFHSGFVKNIQGINGIQFSTLQIGQRAPLFRTYDETGNKVISKDLFSKKKTLLLFINTQCPKCKAILADLNKITSYYDLNTVIINSDQAGDDSVIKSKLNDKITYIRSLQIAQAYYVQNVPYAVVIDYEGKIELNNNLSNIDSLINLLINQKKIAG